MLAHLRDAVPAGVHILVMDAVHDLVEHLHRVGLLPEVEAIVDEPRDGDAEIVGGDDGLARPSPLVPPQDAVQGLRHLPCPETGGDLTPMVKEGVTPRLQMPQRLRNDVEEAAVLVGPL